jgi:hypothetical protein
MAILGRIPGMAPGCSGAVPGLFLGFSKGPLCFAVFGQYDDMKRIPVQRALIICGVIVLAVAGAVGGALVALPRGTPTPTSAETAALVADTHFTPHRALYDLKLVNTKPGGKINNVTGRMMFAWDDACEGWTIEQRLDMDYQYEGGGGQNTKTSLATWESKDAQRFRFAVRRATNGKTTEAFSGYAQMASTAMAHYTEPADMDVPLATTTLFPTLHTLELLHQAKAGNRIFTREVFDGADEQGRNTISAFIGNPQTVMNIPGVPHAKLLAGRAWPVRMAFFAPDNTSGMPDYEMSMLLQENGIARTLTIEYSEFAVEATLRELEPLPAVCS